MATMPAGRGRPGYTAAWAILHSLSFRRRVAGSKTGNSYAALCDRNRLKRRTESNHRLASFAQRSRNCGPVSNADRQPALRAVGSPKHVAIRAAARTAVAHGLDMTVVVSTFRWTDPRIESHVSSPRFGLSALQTRSSAWQNAPPATRSLVAARADKRRHRVGGRRRRFDATLSRRLLKFAEPTARTAVPLPLSIRRGDC